MLAGCPPHGSRAPRHSSHSQAAQGSPQAQHQPTSLCAFFAMAAALSYPIWLLRAVTSIRLSCSSCAIRPSLATMPDTQLSGCEEGGGGERQG